MTDRIGAVPVFIRIAERLKDDIMAGVYKTDELIISTTQIAKLFTVNPATAVKSVGLLCDDGIVYKKRGIGMCVAPRAREIIVSERAGRFYEKTVTDTIREAKKLGISKEELIKIIKEAENYD